MICNTIGSSNRELDYLNMLNRNMVDGIITGSHTLHVEEYFKKKENDSCLWIRISDRRFPW